MCELGFYAICDDELFVCLSTEVFVTCYLHTLDEKFAENPSSSVQRNPLFDFLTLKKYFGCDGCGF